MVKETFQDEKAYSEQIQSLSLKSGDLLIIFFPIKQISSMGKDLEHGPVDCVL